MRISAEHLALALWSAQEWGIVGGRFKNPSHKSLLSAHITTGASILAPEIGKKNQIACLRCEARVPRGSGARPRRPCFLVMWPRVSQETRNLNCPPPTAHHVPLTFCWKYIIWRDGGEMEGKLNRSASFISPKALANHQYGGSVWQPNVVEKPF